MLNDIPNDLLASLENCTFDEVITNLQIMLVIPLLMLT
jgi:hypothetical protein